MTRYCTKCGAINDDMAQYCTNCQAPLTSIGGGSGAAYPPAGPIPPGAITDWKALGADKKVLAGVLGILVGSLGIHKFILGYTNEGIIQIVISVFTCGVGGIIGIVEGIIYLTKSDEEFVRTYIQSKRGWF